MTNEVPKKFLSDGRKVAVLGKLNNVDYIVQEIFVTKSGEEIPSGENFTAKGLHDEPVESYAKKEEARQKDRIKKAEDELEYVRKEIKRQNYLLTAKKEMLANSPELKSLFGEKAKVVAMFMTGTVNYLVVDAYKLTPPVKMEDQIISWESNWGDRRYDSIKLCSILGKSGGDIEYRIHQYYDGSGSSSTVVHPFETLQEAVDKIHSRASEKINGGHLCREEYDVCMSLGIKFSEEELNKFFDTLSKNITANISSVTGSIEKEQARKKEMEDQLSSLKEYIFADKTE